VNRFAFVIVYSSDVAIRDYREKRIYLGGTGGGGRYFGDCRRLGFA
jgi:hypothetical protein